MNELVELPRQTGAPVGTDVLLERGYAALSRKEVQAALGYFAQVLAREPDRVDVLNDCGGIHGLLRRYGEALDFFQQALRVAPGRADVLNNMGLTLGMVGRHQEAVGYLLRALAVQPDYFDVLCNLGHSLNCMGRHGEALTHLDTALGIRRSHAGARCNRGVALAGLGRHAEALGSFKKALRIDARHVSTLVGGACALLSLDRAEEAEQWLSRALRIEGSHIAALGYRATALIRLGRFPEAFECFDRALLLSAAPAQTLHEQAKGLHALGQCAAALERVDRALALAPDLPETVLTRGVVLIDLERFEESLACFDQILLKDPKNLAALNNRAVVLEKLNRYSLALVCLDEALAAHPDDYRSLVNRGITLGRLLRLEESLENLDRALVLQPDSIEALLNRASTLFNMFRLADAQECLERVLRIDPDNADALANMGAISWHHNRNAEARAYLERALALKPGHVNATNNLSFLELAEGHLVKGFAAQEIRWKLDIFAGYRHRSAAPLWLGEQEAGGKTILLQHEQGFGDTLQFIRYARLLADRGARVLLWVPVHLRELLRGVPGVSAVIGDDDPVPAHDLQCPLMSLPLAFGTQMETVPGGVPYIQADPERVLEWRERLGHAQRPRIGLVWAGRQFPPVNVPRDMSLRALLPLLELDAELISLQKDVPHADQDLLESLPAGALKRLGETAGDFSDTAALIECLDLVIAVDTAVVHLAGAMGKPTWIMNRFGSCWRWLRDGRTDSPWYPTARLFRQGTMGDWEGVVAQVKREAEHFIAGWKPAPAAGPDPSVPSPASLMRRAAAQTARGDAAGAIGSYTQILAADPDNLAALCALGSQLGTIGCHAEALACFDKALAGSPDSAELLTNRGAALTALGQVDEALRCLEKALSLDGRNLTARFNRGLALQQLGQPRQALACFDEVLNAEPGHAGARLSRSIAHLTVGNFNDGFSELEWRWRTAAHHSEALPSPAPLWLGKEPLHGKTILLHQEQDVASAIQLARYIPRVAAQAGRVLLKFSTQLRDLLASSFAELPGVEVLPDLQDLPAHDYHCPVQSLPLAFDTRLETIPAQVPYLRPDMQRVGAWRARLGEPAGQRLRVGLVWRERADEARSGRSMGLSDLGPLLELPVELLILHPDCTGEELSFLGGFPNVRCPDEPVEDVASMAALIENLDLLISIDVAAAHLAGALARPVFILLTPGASWCWMQERSDSPWYPFARLFRQSEPGSWGSAVMQAAAAVKEMMELTGARPLLPAPARSSSSAAAGAASKPPQHVTTGSCEEPAATPGDPAAETVPALLERSTALRRKGDLSGALQCCERLLAHDPAHIGGLTARALVLNRLQRSEEALASADRALRLDPLALCARVSRCQALAALNRPHEALACIDETLSLDPEHLDALVSRALVLTQLGRLDEAMACCEAALSLRPEHADAVFTRSFMHLTRGSLLQGFKDRESRWATQLTNIQELSTPVPSWQGGPVEGRRVLAHAERELEETLLLCRYVPLLAARGARVLLRVPSELHALLRSSPCPAELVGEEDPLPPHDLHCPLPSLPLAFGTTLASIPASIPFLAVDPARSARWESRLSAYAAPRIGLAWAADQGRPAQSSRDIPLALLRPLLELDARFISLQDNVPEADRALAGSLPRLIRTGEALSGLEERAALLAGLDLLISADTAVAHLAGAMGKPVWVLAPVSGSWCWLRDREDSPWYPTARVFRQRAAGEWGGVIRAVQQAAHAFIAGFAAGGKRR